jgi:hypothetical protein
MKTFKQFVGKTVDTIMQNDDGANSYFIIKFTDGTKMNIVGYISDDEHNKINLKAKTYESKETPKLYIEENITDYMSGTKKLDESFINITVNIGKDDVLTQSIDYPSIDIVSPSYDSSMSSPNDGDKVINLLPAEEDEEVDYDEEDYDEEDADFDGEDIDEDEVIAEDDKKPISYIKAMSDMNDPHQYEKDEIYDDSDYDGDEDEDVDEDDEDKDFDEDEDFDEDDEDDEDKDFDEDEDFDEVDAVAAEQVDDDIIDDEDDEEVGSEDVETVLSNQLLSPEYNRESFDFKDEKSGKDFSGIVLGKLSGGYFLFKTDDGIKKVHFNNIYED